MPFVVLTIVLSLLAPAGRAAQPARSTEKPPVEVLIFMRTDCAETARYATEIQRLQGKYFGKGVGFFLVFPNPADTEEVIEKYFVSHGYIRTTYLRQNARQEATRARATTTPEAAVFDHEALVYHGRIGDPAPEMRGKNAEGAHELDSAIAAALQHHAPAASSTAVSGCPLF